MSLRLKQIFLTIAIAIGFGAFAQSTHAQTMASVLPSGGGAALIDTSDVVMLLLDHQAGLFQTVKDLSVTELRNNTVMLPNWRRC